MKLSVVLISRNQAWNITRLIESVLQETEVVPDREIVLVDSASVDRTIDEASRYPIRILRLSPNQPLTAAAGRYVGYKHTTGAQVLFLDGDMDLQPGWLTAAIEFLDRNPGVGAVTGQVIDIPPITDDTMPAAQHNSPCPLTSISFCGGAGMYRRAVLDEVGQFNPYLYADEEPDLCLRIRMAGYSVIRLEQIIVNHYSDTSESFSGVVARWRRKHYLGGGQNLRYKLHTRLLWPYIRERGYAFVPAVALAAGIVSLLWYFIHSEPKWFELWLFVVLAVLAVDAVRKRSLRRPLVSLLKRLFVIAGTIKGFSQEPRPPATYPCIAEVIKPVHHSATSSNVSPKRCDVNHNVETALRLHEFMLAHHWIGNRLIGPDAGVRFNLRVMRFIRSHIPMVQWKDNYYYLQAQGYWVLANWRLFAGTGSTKYSEIAIRCSDSILASQRADGAWDYPNPEWRGRIATAEGTWASIGLLQTYHMTQDPRYLDAVLHWYRFLLEQVKFVQLGDEVAVNYFANRRTSRVPNNSAFVARFFAELADRTASSEYLQLCSGLIRFLVSSQILSGELPYTVAETSATPVRPHYQCYQYNAYQCLDLMRYYEITHDQLARQVILKLLKWLTTGVCPDGHVRFDCRQNQRRIAYHTTVLAAAFATATAMAMGDYRDLAARCFAYARKIQRSDGSFGFSEGDYHVLKDGRAYPRALAMMLFHLLTEVEVEVMTGVTFSAATCPS